MDEWTQVSEEKFLSEIKSRAKDSHMFAISEPPIRFYWDEDGVKQKNRAFGAHAFAKIIHYYDMFHRRERPEYYLKGE